MLKIKKILSTLLVLFLVFSIATNNETIHAEDSGIARITIQDTSGIPLSNLDFTVRSTSGAVMQFSGSGGIYTYGGGSSTVTCSSGLIRLDNLPVGSYTISYSGNDSSYAAEGLSFSISANNTTYETLTVRNLSGSLNLIITGDSGERLSGVSFRIQQNGQNVRFVYDGTGYIQNSNGNDTLITNGNGQILINQLSSGTYTAVQDNYVSNYNAGKVSQTFNISPGNNTNLNVSNSKNYGSLRITAVDDKGNQVAETLNVRLNGYNISVFNSGNATFEYSANAGTDQIAVTGYATITGLPFGEYVVHVANVDNKFTAAEDQRVYIGSNSTQEVRLVNKIAATEDSDGATLNQESTALKILVSSEDGVVDAYPFQILDSNSKEVTLREAGSGLYEYASNAKTKTFYTNSSGVLVINGLPAGKYSVVDQKLGGYKYQKTKKSVDLANGKIEEYRFTAVPTKYSLALSSDGSANLASVPVKIYDSNNELVLEALSDPNGDIVLDGFEDGNYTAEIEELPNGFINKKYKVDFKVDNNSSDLVAETINLEETFIQVKTGEKGETVVLRNTLTNEEKKMISDDKGVVVFKGLQDGEYTVTYADNKEIITIDRNYSGAPVDFSKPDSTIKPNEDPTLEPSSSGTGIAFLDNLPFPWYWLLLPLLLLLALIGLLASLAVRKKKQNEAASVDSTNLSTADLSRELGVGFDSEDGLLVEDPAAYDTEATALSELNTPVIDNTQKIILVQPEFVESEEIPVSPQVSTVEEYDQLNPRDKFLLLMQEDQLDVDATPASVEQEGAEAIKTFGEIEESIHEMPENPSVVTPEEILSSHAEDSNKIKFDELLLEPEEEQIIPEFKKKTNDLVSFSDISAAVAQAKETVDNMVSEASSELNAFNQKLDDNIN